MASKLASSFPEATEGEVERFIKANSHLRGKPDKVHEMIEQKMEAYLDWRNCFGLDYERGEEEEDSDTRDWQIAVEKAWHVEKSINEARELAKNLEIESKMTEEEKIDADADYDKQLEAAIASNDEEDEEKKVDGEGDKEEEAYAGSDFVQSELDQVLFMHKTETGDVICDKDGAKILQVLPGRINRKFAPGRIYANAFAFYLDRKFDRMSTERVTILLDVRAGEGWPNPPAVAMVNFIRVVAKVLEANFPERVEKFICFPVPRVATGLFNTCKRLFRSNSIGKLVLVSGPAASRSPLPKKEITEHIPEEQLDVCEKARIGTFKVLEKPSAKPWFAWHGGKSSNQKEDDKAEKDNAGNTKDEPEVETSEKDGGSKND